MEIYLFKSYSSMYADNNKYMKDSRLISSLSRKIRLTTIQSYRNTKINMRFAHNASPHSISIVSDNNTMYTYDTMKNTIDSSSCTLAYIYIYPTRDHIIYIDTHYMIHVYNIHIDTHVDILDGMGVYAKKDTRVVSTDDRHIYYVSSKGGLACIDMWDVTSPCNTPTVEDVASICECNQSVVVLKSDGVVRNVQTKKGKRILKKFNEVMCFVEYSMHLVVCSYVHSLKKTTNIYYIMHKSRLNTIDKTSIEIPSLSSASNHTSSISIIRSVSPVINIIVSCCAIHYVSILVYNRCNVRVLIPYRSVYSDDRTMFKCMSVRRKVILLYGDGVDLKLIRIKFRGTGN